MKHQEVNMGEPAKVIKPSKKDHSVLESIKNRQTPELVFGFCGALGSGISKVIDVFTNHFDKLSYDTNKIKISDLIQRKAKTQVIFGSEGERIEKLQQLGNQLRDKNSHYYLAECAIEEIHLKRQEKHRMDVDNIAPIKSVWFIDSIKHPEEVNLLRTVYGDMFYLIGVLCPESTRLKRLTDDKKLEQHKAMELINKDKSEDIENGQKLIKTLQYADFFINNSSYNTSDIDKTSKRFIDLLFGQNISPTISEYAMYIAKAASYRSACLSRQVGSAIIGNNREIIATGCNDVPKPYGGLYNSEDMNDNRCYNYKNNKCSNDSHKSEISAQISKILIKNGIENILKDKIVHEIAENTKIKTLTEFTRAVHAEMDAILLAARLSNASLVGTTMYVTTFPCHNCAKHIIAAGIKKVYYIEPYEKSLAIKLHEDSISLDSKDSNDKVVFLPFEGVSPQQYAKIFKQREERKNDGKAVETDIANCLPASEKYIDSFITYEAKVVADLNKSMIK